MGHNGILMTLAQPFGNDRFGDTRVKDAVFTFLRERVREAARERLRAERRARELRATGGEEEGAEASGDIQPAGG
jgi:hypothetical protein